MNAFLYAYIIFFPRKLSAVIIIPIESMNKVNCFLGHCFTLFLGKLYKCPFLCFSSLADWIKYSETSKYSEQYLCDQKSGNKVNICNFYLFEVVSNFSFLTACSLSSSSALFLVSLSHIGGGFSISISETYAAEMFSLYTFKTLFSIYLLHLKCDCCKLFILGYTLPA